MTTNSPSWTFAFGPVFVKTNIGGGSSGSDVLCWRFGVLRKPKGEKGKTRKNEYQNENENEKLVGKGLLTRAVGAWVVGIL